ncbi:hypothetical protein [Bradyrhizobium sp. 33ap4]|uniref:hypothetical protein n=1 Tax=Bradyrhizobium sp. 33ap4 TaxID=3061630 RepID=UPI002931CFA2|nr:hypothetical protein [Bradyrhizobium sp. 33ap4]
MKTEMYRFETKHFQIIASIVPDTDLDLSWDEDGETRAKLESGEYEAFGTVVDVFCNSAKVGSDSLWGSIYVNPREFFDGHRDADPLNRNSSIMRDARGQNVCICHYFPDMIRQAIREARETLDDMPALRKRD